VLQLAFANLNNSVDVAFVSLRKPTRFLKVGK